MFEGHSGDFGVAGVILCFILGRWQVAERFEQANGVESDRPFQHRQFQVFQSAPLAIMINHFGFVQADDGFRERVVVGIATTSNRQFDAGVRQALRVAN